jgi:hypothetical protein
MEKSANILGKIQRSLQNYDELKINFGCGFLRSVNAIERKQQYFKQLDEAVDKGNDASLVFNLKKRLRHLDRISMFDIDSTKITYSNSHGDFYIGQIIVKDQNITVIDWTSACKLPAGLEVIMSYVSAAPECKNGKIDSDGLKRHIDHYSKYSILTDYEITKLPYLFYFQQIMCHYSPPYDSIPDTYKPICSLINNFTNWLYENVEILEKELAR